MEFQYNDTPTQPTNHSDELYDRVDATINAIATRALAGKLDETQARWMILAELIDANIPKRVARSVSGITMQVRDDLAEAIIELLEQKAIQEDGGLDLNQAAVKSGCGWAVNLSRSAVPSLLRNIRRHTAEKFVLVDQTLDITADNEVTNARGAELAWHTAATEFDITDADEDEELFLTTQQEFEEASHNARLRQRRAHAAQALRAAYRIDAPIRPADPVEREMVRQLLAEDEELVNEGVGEMPRVKTGLAARSLDLSFATGKAATATEKAMQALAALWDDYPQEVRELLAARPAVAHTLAMDVVSLAARPHRKAVGAVLSAMRSTYEPETSTYRPWRALTRALVDSWLACETEARSLYDTRGAEDPEAEAKRMSDMLAWPERAMQMAKWPGAPLGNTTEQVHTFITRGFAALAGNTAEVASGVTQQA